MLGVKRNRGKGDAPKVYVSITPVSLAKSWAVHTQGEIMNNEI
jgi:hypothetical protein